MALGYNIDLLPRTVLVVEILLDTDSKWTGWCFLMQNSAFSSGPKTPLDGPFNPGVYEGSEQRWLTWGDFRKGACDV